MESECKCPYCGSRNIVKVAIMAACAFGGDLMCKDCGNAFWKEKLGKRSKKKAYVHSEWTLYCPNCKHAFDAVELHRDEMGWHTVCPKCESSFDVDVELP